MDAKIPAWLTDMPDNTTLTSVDVGVIFGLRKHFVVDRAVAAGQCPPSAFRTTTDKFKTPTHRWVLGDIRKFIADRS